jgi:hypothetical protein
VPQGAAGGRLKGFAGKEKGKISLDNPMENVLSINRKYKGE